MGNIQTESVMSEGYKQMQADADNAKSSSDVVPDNQVDEKLSGSESEQVESDEKASESDAQEEETEEKPEADKESESEKSEDEKSEDEESEDDKESDKEDEEDEKPKGKRAKSGFQKRINKLNSRVQAAKEEAEYWRQEALKKASKTSAEDESEVKAAKKDAPGKPISDEFETYDEYMEALADWKADQKLEAYKEQAKADALKAKVSDRVRTHNERVDSYRESNPDFDNDLADFFEDQGDDFKLSMPLEEAITESDNGPELLHELVRDPEEFERINSMGVMGAARAIGRLEAKLDLKHSTVSEKKEAKRKTTKAPPTFETVKAKGSAVAKDPVKMSQKEYEKWRMAKS